MLVAVICIVCIVWVILTVITQFEFPLSRTIMGLDRFGLIPLWTFFAPTPSNTDIHLLVRFRKGNELSAWSETALTLNLHKRPKLLRGLFNPYKRIEKLLFDFSNDIIFLKKNHSQIRHLTGYILILRIVEKLAEKQGADSVQFMLAGTNLSLLDKLKIFLVSDIHQVTTDK